MEKTMIHGYTSKTLSRGMLAVFIVTLSACDAQNAFEAHLPTGMDLGLDVTQFAINDGDSDTLNVVLVDGAGNPVDMDIEWSSSAASIVLVTSEGVVTGERPGEATVTASVGDLSASATVTVRAVPVRLEYVDGAGQTGSPTTPLPTDLRVRLVDRRGSPVGSVMVDFTVQGGGGAASPATVTTNSQGFAASTWTLGSTGSQQVTAVAHAPSHVSSIQDSTVTFVASVASTSTATPARVSDLTAVAGGDSVVLRWTQMTDGEGNPAAYAVRYGSPTLTWSTAAGTERLVTGTSIGASGTYTYRGLTAGTTYQFQVISYRGTLDVNAVFGERSNVVTASVPVSASPRITISPAGGTLYNVGDTVTLSAVARASDGSVITNPGITWTSLNPTVASVNQMGMITARALGQVLIVASAACCTADTAAIDVIENGTPGSYPNRPAGLTLIGAVDGSVKAAADGSAFGISDFGGWSSNNHIDVVTDASNPSGSGQSLRFRWDVGDREAGTATAGGFSGGPYRELYIMTRVFFEPGGWDFGHKFFYIGDAHSTASSPTQYYADRPGGGFPQRLRLVNQGSGSTVVVNSADPAPTGSNSNPLVAGRWLNIEYRFVASSSAGATDGQMHIWVNGVLVGRNMAVRWTTGFSGMEWYAHANSVPTESFYRLGELYISGRR